MPHRRRSRSVTLTGAQLNAAAREIKAAQDQARQIEPFAGRIEGFDLDAGYEVARRVHADRLAEGARALGRKIGFTNYGMWTRYGVCDPIWAYVYDRTVAHLSDAAACSLAAYAEPKIEPEIAFRFRSAPPAGGDLAAILDSIEWVAPAFEIVQSHFPGWVFEAADTVADSSLHGCLLLGEPQAVASLGADPIAALADFSITLYKGDVLVEQGRGSNVLGSPLRAVVHLIDLLSRQQNSERLKAGEIVTTGTVTLAHTVRAGETWRTEVAGIALPGLAVSFAR
jgi:2-keto-4-pentenoate hydratase